MNRNTFFLLFFFIIISPVVLAVGIQQPSLAARTIIFEPHKEVTIPYNLVGAEYIHTYKRAGNLNSSVTINDPDQDGGPRSINVDIKLPESLDPGTYTIFIGGLETSPGGTGQVGGVAAIESRITIISLYPGIYPLFSIQPADVGVGQNGTVKVDIQNMGQDKINAAQAVIDIVDSDNNTIGTIYSNVDSIDSNSGKTLEAQLDAAQLKLKQGAYILRVHIVTDGKISSVQEKELRVGSLSVAVVDWTKEIYAGAINKFTISIESDWASPIEGVYAKIYLPDKTVVKTPNLDITKFQRATLEGYIDATNFSLGNNSFDVEVFFAQSSIRKTIPVIVTQGTPAETATAQREEPQKTTSGTSSGMSTTTIVIIALAILIVVNVFFLFKKNKPPQASGPSQVPPKV